MPMDIAQFMLRALWLSRYFHRGYSMARVGSHVYRVPVTVNVLVPEKHIYFVMLEVAMPILLYMFLSSVFTSWNAFSLNV